MIGLAIGSSAKWATKRWPLASFQELARQLTQELNAQIVLIGSEEDTKLADEFMSGVPKRCLNLVGKTGISDLAAVVERCDVLVTGDTAPLHIASAMKTKIVALFGPTDPKRHMPPDQDAVLLTRYVSCQPCYKGECFQAEKLACLTKISISEVANAVKKHLAALENSEKKVTV